MWPGVEPVRGSYNETYLAEIRKIVDLAYRYGIYTILDMHQDLLTEQYCGEGVPPWAVKQDDTKCDLPFCGLPPGSDDDVYGLVQFACGAVAKKSLKTALGKNSPAFLTCERPPFKRGICPSPARRFVY